MSRWSPHRPVSGASLRIARPFASIVRVSGRSHQFRRTQATGIDAIGAFCANVDALSLRGGFPDSLSASSDALSLTWRDIFIRTHLEREVPQFSRRVPSATLRRFWTTLAHKQEQQLHAHRFAASLDVSGDTVAGTWICSLICCWSAGCLHDLTTSASVWCKHQECMCATAASCTRCSVSSVLIMYSAIQSLAQTGRAWWLKA